MVPIWRRRVAVHRHLWGSRVSSGSRSPAVAGARERRFPAPCLGRGSSARGGHAAADSRAGHSHQEHVRLSGPGEDPVGEGGEAAPARAAPEGLPGGAWWVSGEASGRAPPAAAEASVPAPAPHRVSPLQGSLSEPPFLPLSPCPQARSRVAEGVKLRGGKPGCGLLIALLRNLADEAWGWTGVGRWRAVKGWSFWSSQGLSSSISATGRW